MRTIKLHHLKIRAGLLLLSCLLFSGCFEFTQEFWINADGSGRVLMDIAVKDITDPKAQQNANTAQGKPSEFERNMAEAKERLSKDPNIKSVQMNQFVQDGMRHTVFDIECKDITLFSKTMNENAKQVANTSNTNGKVATNGAQEATSQTMVPVIQKLPNGNYSFTSNLEKNDKSKKSKPASNQMEQMTQKWVEKIFEGRYYTVRLHAPKVISSNGQVNSTSNMVEWKIPIAQLASDNPPYKELTAQVSVPSIISPQRWFPELTSASGQWRPFHFAILGGAGLLLLIGFVLFFKAFRKNQSNSNDQQILRTILLLFSICALYWVSGPSAHAQNLGGMKLGDLPGAVDRNHWKLIASDGAQTFRQEKYRDSSGTTLAIAYDRQTRKALFIEMDWNGNARGKNASGIPSLVFGTTTLEDIRRMMGSNGFAYGSNGGMVRDGDRLVAFNAYELKDRPNTVAVFITSIYIPDLGGRMPKVDEMAKLFKLESIILSEVDYLDSLWGEAKVYDPDNKPASWPTQK